MAGETERVIAVHAHGGRGGTGGPIRRGYGTGGPIRRVYGGGGASGGGFERSGTWAAVRQALQQVAADGGHMEQGEKNVGYSIETKRHGAR